MRRAGRHHAWVGVEHAGDVGVELARVGACSVAARATAVVSEPPRPRNVISRSVDTPWAPPTTATWPSAIASLMRSGLTSRILALRCSVSVRKPAWLPVKLAAGQPISSSAITTSAVALRSPAVISMSISRPGGFFETWLARWISSSVSLPMAETTTTTSLLRRVRTMFSATARMRSGSATDVPPYFWTTKAHGVKGTGVDPPPSKSDNGP